MPKANTPPPEYRRATYTCPDCGAEVTILVRHREVPTCNGSDRHKTKTMRRVETDSIPTTAR